MRQRPHGAEPELVELAVHVAEQHQRRLEAEQMTKSAGEARRLINQGAVRLDETPITENVEANLLRPGILRIGKRRYLRLL